MHLPMRLLAFTTTIWHILRTWAIIQLDSHSLWLMALQAFFSISRNLIWIPHCAWAHIRQPSIIGRIKSKRHRCLRSFYIARSSYRACLLAFEKHEGFDHFIYADRRIVVVRRRCARWRRRNIRREELKHTPHSRYRRLCTNNNTAAPNMIPFLANLSSIQSIAFEGVGRNLIDLGSFVSIIEIHVQVSIGSSGAVACETTDVFPSKAPSQFGFFFCFVRTWRQWFNYLNYRTNLGAFIGAAYANFEGSYNARHTIDCNCSIGMLYTDFGGFY
mmetsp:Transcript_28885/g.41958  ORF Transcript_28885/g.41958 Transcript_28885/m.41958 type:complete len:273 (+) Transcript_28885:1226-2044(+)